MTPFLDKVTKDKVIFVTASNPDEMALLHTHFDVRLLQRRA